MRDHVQDKPEPNELVTFAPSQFPKSGAISQGETFTYIIPITSASVDKPFIATLAWTDPPGNLGAMDVLVNDLDLVVTLTERNGSVSRLWGNGQLNGDRYNNVEQIRIERSGPGDVNVSVFARRITASITSYNNPTPAQVKVAEMEVELQQNIREYTANITNQTVEELLAAERKNQRVEEPITEANAALVSVPCQPFALVMTGNIEGGVSRPIDMQTYPSPFVRGVCGRPFPDIPPPPPALSDLQLGLIIGGALGGWIVALLIAYRYGALCGGILGAGSLPCCLRTGRCSHAHAGMLGRSMWSCAPYGQQTAL